LKQLLQQYESALPKGNVKKCGSSFAENIYPIIALRKYKSKEEESWKKSRKINQNLNEARVILEKMEHDLREEKKI
jgi:5-bromo-4-chloroindolyl phosphate hydrolysis protein